MVLIWLLIYQVFSRLSHRTGARRGAQRHHGRRVLFKIVISSIILGERSYTGFWTRVLFRFLDDEFLRTKVYTSSKCQRTQRDRSDNDWWTEHRRLGGRDVATCSSTALDELVQWCISILVFPGPVI